MQIECDTLDECRHVAHRARFCCRAESVRNGHDVDSCACPTCRSYRLLGTVVQEIGSLDKTTLERDQWNR